MSLKNDHSLALLDFFRIRERAAEYCLSEEGGALMRVSVPIADAFVLARFKGDLVALRDHLASNELPSFVFPQMGSALKRLGLAGMTLELEELFALGLWTREFDRLLAYLARIKLPPSSILRDLGNGSLAGKTFDPSPLAEEWALHGASELIALAPKLQDVYKIIFEIVTLEGELRDLPEIRRIKESIARANKDLLSIADSYRSDPDLRSALQSEEPTQRDGRTVLAVRANFKGRVKGIVHEVSATGQTVFIEPAALVEKNNELVQLEAKLRAEIFRILKETTEKLRPRAPGIEAARIVLAYLDTRNGQGDSAKARGS